MAKEDTLRVFWNKRQKDVLYAYPGSRADARLMDNVFSQPRWSYDGKSGPSLLAELEARGYDITTLKFSIKKKLPQHPEDGDDGACKGKDDKHSP